jgi:hypothetical protein
MIKIAKIIILIIIVSFMPNTIIFTDVSGDYTFTIVEGEAKIDDYNGKC